MVFNLTNLIKNLMEDLLTILFISIFLIVQINSLDLEKIRADILDNHNYHRKRHQVGELTRNKDIETIAQSYSQYLASIDTIKYSKNKKYGENIYFINSNQDINNIGEKASQNWYQEIFNYDFINRKYINTPETRHFTQLIWKETKFIGCGASCNKNSNCFIVCNYYPTGNNLDEFKNNVFPLLDDLNKDKIDNKFNMYNKLKDIDEFIYGNGNDNNTNNTSDDGGNNTENEGMSTAGKVVLAVVIIIISLILIFSIYHCIARRRRFKENDLFLARTYY